MRDCSWRTCPAAFSRDRARSAVLALTALLLAALPWTGGCKPDAPPPGAHAQVGGLEARGISPDDLLKNAVQPLNHLEDFASGEMLQHIVERLNQWVETEEPLPDWKADPMVADLPQALRELPQVADLDKLEFPREDAFALQETVWLRDLSGWARGETLNEVEQARRLFDWTVRNIQLDPTPLGPEGRPLQRVRQIPWEILLLGRGTPMLIIDPVPGQEEWNADFVAGSGAGIQIRMPELVPPAVEALLAQPERLAAMRAQAKLVGKPRAAFDIAERVLADLRQSA